MSGNDPIKELAALFLTEPDEPLTAQAAPCELVVVGSLPVRASVWLTPYADALARECGPVGLLRLDGEAPTLQLIRGAWPAGGPWKSLSAAVTGLAGHVAAWIVRPPPAATSTELLAAGADRIVILSSVNETAIVRAYQEVKSFWTVAAARATPLPPLGLAVLGADRHSAELFHRRLSHTASTALGVELSLSACVQRIDATIRSSEVLTYADEPFPALEAVLGWIRTEEPAPAAGPAPAPALRPRPVAFEPGPPRPAAPYKLGPKPGAEPLPGTPAPAAREPDHAGFPEPMAQYVDGLVALPVRCPGHERLEIGADAAGRLHVLAREADLRRLHIVEAWARAHRELIARACDGQSFDPQAHCVLHVFTDRPASVSDLHGSGLLLHVLAPVSVEGRQGWYHAALNSGLEGGHC